MQYIIQKDIRNLSFYFKVKTKTIIDRLGRHYYKADLSWCLQ
jgi:hypothetical protein